MEARVKPPYATSLAQMGGRQQGKTAAQLLEEDESFMAKHQIDALKYAMQGAMTQQVPKKPDIRTVSDAEMVMEMIRRGFAVMKLPEDGGPPEALR